MRTPALLAAIAVLMACAPAHADETELLKRLSDHSRSCKIAADAKNLNDAWLYCNQANQVRPLAENYVNLGSAFYENGRYAEAASRFVEAVNMKPGFAIAHYDLGLAYQMLGQTERALEQLQQAQKLGEKSASETIAEIAAKSAVANAATQTRGSR